MGAFTPSDLDQNNLLTKTALYLQRQSICNLDYAFTVAQHVLAVLTGNKARLLNSGDSRGHTAVNLYTVCVGPSAKARKSTLANAAIALVREASKKTLFCATSVTYEGAFAALHDRQENGRARALMGYADEFGEVIGKQKDYNRSQQTDLTKMYNGEHDSHIRAAKEKKDKIRVIEDFCFSFHASTTASWFFDAMRNGGAMFVGGFLNRFGYAILEEDSPVLKVDPDRKDDKAAFLSGIPPVTYADLLPDLVAHFEAFDALQDSERIFLCLDDSAATCLSDYMRDMESHYRQTIPDYMDSPQDAVISRKREQIRRTAAIIRLGRIDAKEIAPISENKFLERHIVHVEEADVAVAIRYHHAQTENLLRLLDDNSLGDNPLEAACKHFLKLAEKRITKGTLPLHDFQGSPLPYVNRETFLQITRKNSKAADDLVRELEERGCIVTAKAQTGSRMPTTIYGITGTPWEGGNRS